MAGSMDAWTPNWTRQDIAIDTRSAHSAVTKFKSEAQHPHGLLTRYGHPLCMHAFNARNVRFWPCNEASGVAIVQLQVRVVHNVYTVLCCEPQAVVTEANCEVASAN